LPTDLCCFAVHANEEQGSKEEPTGTPGVSFLECHMTTNSSLSRHNESEFSKIEEELQEKDDDLSASRKGDHVFEENIKIDMLQQLLHQAATTAPQKNNCYINKQQQQLQKRTIATSASSNNSTNNKEFLLHQGATTAPIKVMDNHTHHLSRNPIKHMEDSPS
jgi:hypothetical protein